MASIGAYASVTGIVLFLYMIFSKAISSQKELSNQTH